MLYARIKYKVQQVSTPIYFATMPFQSAPALNTKGSNFPVPTPWANEEKRLQTLQVWERQYTPHVWLVNSEADPLREEYITTAGNVVSYNSIINNHLMVRAFQPDENPANVYGLENMNYITQPDLFHKVTCMNNAGAVSNPGKSQDMYHIILNNGHPWTDDLGALHEPACFIDMSEVELFPALPADGSGLLVTITSLPGVFVRSGYSTAAPIVSSYLYSQKVKVLEYRPRGSDVWGRTDKGWFCLQKNTWFSSTWKMATRPPIPPAS